MPSPVRKDRPAGFFITAGQVREKAKEIGTRSTGHAFCREETRSAARAVRLGATTLAEAKRASARRPPERSPDPIRRESRSHPTRAAAPARGARRKHQGRQPRRSARPQDLLRGASGAPSCAAPMLTARSARPTKIASSALVSTISSIAYRASASSIMAMTAQRASCAARCRSRAAAPNCPARVAGEKPRFAA